MEPDPRIRPVRRDAEVAVFVTRRGGRDVLLLQRSPEHGGYWHVVAGGVEAGETAVEAAVRELREETGLEAPMTEGIEVTEYVSTLTKGPADRDDPAALAIGVTCFRVAAPDDWEPTLDWEHDGHRWCNSGEAARTLRWPGTAQALRELVALDAA
jgi:8-oxo-dGTP pyrophosphatase MutT (NUDIX family)